MADSTRLHLRHRADDVTTTPQSFKLKRGVCGTARTSSLPPPASRHPRAPIGGHYCRTGDGAPQDAGHWAEAYVEKLGWVGFDPTNAISPTEAHVRVAASLDYLGAAPVRVASAATTMTVAAAPPTGARLAVNRDQ
jgi:transglutaminase-like putative cysteine protease